MAPLNAAGVCPHTTQLGDTPANSTGITLYNRTNEMHYFSFIFDKILYMFRIGKLFVNKTRNVMCSVWYVSYVVID